jgi:hypothetical protein
MIFRFIRECDADGMLSIKEFWQQLRIKMAIFICFPFYIFFYMWWFAEMQIPYIMRVPCISVFVLVLGITWEMDKHQENCYHCQTKCCTAYGCRSHAHPQEDHIVWISSDAVPWDISQVTSFQVSLFFVVVVVFLVTMCKTIILPALL